MNPTNRQQNKRLRPLFLIPCGPGVACDPSSLFPLIWERLPPPSSPAGQAGERHKRFGFRGRQLWDPSTASGRPAARGRVQTRRSGSRGAPPFAIHLIVRETPSVGIPHIAALLQVLGQGAPCSLRRSRSGWVDVRPSDASPGSTMMLGTSAGPQATNIFRAWPSLSRCSLPSAEPTHDADLVRKAVAGAIVSRVPALSRDGCGTARRAIGGIIIDCPKVGRFRGCTVGSSLSRGPGTSIRAL